MWSSNCDQLPQLIAGLPQGIVPIDTDLNIVAVNRAALQTYDADDIAGRGATRWGYLKRIEPGYNNDQHSPHQPKVPVIMTARHFAHGHNVSNGAVVDGRASANPRWRYIVGYAS